MIRYQSGRRGFSLLEMVITLFIIMILMGLAIGVSREVFANEELKDTGREIALLAKEARRRAVLENRTYEILIEERSLTLQTVPESGDLAASEDFYAEETGGNALEVYELPGSVAMKVLLWGATDWDSLKNLKEPLVWSFPATGLCAPNRFRLERGEAWMEVGFNPLTANRQDEEWYLP